MCVCNKKEYNKNEIKIPFDLLAIQSRWED